VKSKLLKSICTIMITVLMVSVLGGCDATSSDESDSATNAVEDTKNVEKEEVPEVTEEPVSTPEPTAEPTQPYVAGVITDNTYESEWLDMTFTAPEGFVIMTDEELKGVTDEQDSPESIYELGVRNETWNPYMFLTIDSDLTTYVTAESYAAMSKGHFLDNEEGTIIEDIHNITVAGREFAVFKVSFADGDQTTVNEMYFSKIDDYLIHILICSDEGNQDLNSTIINAFELPRQTT